jgi:hypothetical protein
MKAQHDRRPAAIQPIDHGERPGRPGGVERGRGIGLGHGQHRVDVAARRPAAAEVLRQRGLVVVAPARPAQAQRRWLDPLAQARQERPGSLDRPRQPVGRR